TRTSPPPICTPSLHDALPISLRPVGSARLRTVGGVGVRVRTQTVSTDRRVDDRETGQRRGQRRPAERAGAPFEIRTADGRGARPDRKSTRLNTSHVAISYAVF